MAKFVAVYITTNGKEWESPLCVELNVTRCKDAFCEWYKTVDYKDIGVRYAAVEIVEKDKELYR